MTTYACDPSAYILDTIDANSGGAATGPPTVTRSGGVAAMDFDNGAQVDTQGPGYPIGGDWYVGLITFRQDSPLPSGLPLVPPFLAAVHITSETVSEGKPFSTAGPDGHNVANRFTWQVQADPPSVGPGYPFINWVHNTYFPDPTIPAPQYWMGISAGPAIGCQIGIWASTPALNSVPDVPGPGSTTAVTVTPTAEFTMFLNPGTYWDAPSSTYLVQPGHATMTIDAFIFEGTDDGTMTSPITSATGASWGILAS